MDVLARIRAASLPIDRLIAAARPVIMMVIVIPPVTMMVPPAHIAARQQYSAQTDENQNSVFHSRDPVSLGLERP
jgi:hypothetical protein